MPKTAVKKEAKEAPKEELAVETPQALANARPQLQISVSDIDIPKLNVIQKTSSIPGTAGSIMLDQKHEVVAPGEQVSVTIVSAIKRWREDIDFDSDEMPRYADTEEEKAELEKDTEWSVIEIADISMLLEAPEGSDSLTYPYPIGDKQYAFGKINVQKDGYRFCYKRLATLQSFNPSLALEKTKWTFEADLLTRGKYSWFVPMLSANEDKPSDEVVDFVSNLWNS